MSSYATRPDKPGSVAAAFGSYAGNRRSRLTAQVVPGSFFLGWTSPGNWEEQTDSVTARSMQGCQMLRLDPDQLREPSALIADGQELRLSERGRGLPAVYDAIITRDINAYVEISKRLSALFPSIKSLHLKNPSSTTKALGVQLHDGTTVAVETMSEGLLYWLAFAALPYLAPTSLLLIEEPEVVSTQRGYETSLRSCERFRRRHR